MRLAKAPESRGSNREFPAADQGAVDRDREEHVRVPDGIVVKEIARLGAKFIDVERPALKRDNNPELALFITLSM
jgi:hypothetical protein